MALLSSKQERSSYLRMYSTGSCWNICNSSLELQQRGRRSPWQKRALMCQLLIIYLRYSLLMTSWRQFTRLVMTSSFPLRYITSCTTASQSLTAYLALNSRAQPLASLMSWASLQQSEKNLTQMRATMDWLLSETQFEGALRMQLKKTIHLSIFQKSRRQVGTETWKVEQKHCKISSSSRLVLSLQLVNTCSTMTSSLGNTLTAKTSSGSCSGPSTYQQTLATCLEKYTPASILPPKSAISCSSSPCHGKSTVTTMYTISLYILTALGLCLIQQNRSRRLPRRMVFWSLLILFYWELQRAVMQFLRVVRSIMRRGEEEVIYGMRRRSCQVKLGCWLKCWSCCQDWCTVEGFKQPWRMVESYCEVMAPFCYLLLLWFFCINLSIWAEKVTPRLQI